MAQLRGLGLGPRGTAHRAARGKLHRVHRGVYAVGHTVLGRTGGGWLRSWRAGPARCSATAAPWISTACGRCRAAGTR
ncbi:MAG: type IV toxin-antitoxin system AbiEi family antitoxin domain-containing protein [Solirubrobacteraceae bacterium]